MTMTSEERLRRYLSTVETPRIDRIVKRLEKECETYGEGYIPHFTYQYGENYKEHFDTIEEILKANEKFTYEEILIVCSVYKEFPGYSKEITTTPLFSFKLSLQITRYINTLKTERSNKKESGISDDIDSVDYTLDFDDGNDSDNESEPFEKLLNQVPIFNGLPVDRKKDVAERIYAILVEESQR